MTKYILSIDGGGIRGIIPAIVLAEIEKRIKKPIARIFDLMAGTSSGGILAAGLCSKNNKGNPQYTANDLIEFYLKYGIYIFKSSFFRRSILSWFSCPQYSHKNIELILEKYFDDDILKNALTNLLITSYDVRHNYPFFFKSWKENKNFIKVKDALRATTALPTYFKPKHLTVNDKKVVLVDGSIFANNPAACAYASSRNLFGNEEIIMLSIGTGRVNRCFGGGHFIKFGRTGWIMPILHTMNVASLTIVDYQVNKIIGDKYIRIQTELNVALSQIDNVTCENIKSLQQQANIMIEDNQELIDKFCNFVS